MNFLKDNQKYLTHPNKVIEETSQKYILENGVHVSKSSGRELCPNDSSRMYVHRHGECLTIEEDDSEHSVFSGSQKECEDYIENM